MSLRSGIFEFSVPLSLVATPADAVRNFPVTVSKGTYIISVNLQVNCNAVPQGILVSLQTVDTPPPVLPSQVILRNTAEAVNACSARPSGAGNNQSINLQGVYTFQATTTCYLVVGGNLGVGETFALTPSVSINTINFARVDY